ncbi:TPA: hypothetical protein MJA52_001918 [Klebsiella aerogenes]|nr:hypothetical protein [Klebsiella aerogenes]
MLNRNKKLECIAISAVVGLALLLQSNVSVASEKCFSGVITDSTSYNEYDQVRLSFRLKNINGVSKNYELFLGSQPDEIHKILFNQVVSKVDNAILAGYPIAISAHDTCQGALNVKSIFLKVCTSLTDC